MNAWPTPTFGTMLWRGLRRRCPRCGERHLFASAFRLRERCPRCGLLFEREEGCWLGAYVINFGVGEGLVGVLLIIFLFVKVNSASTPLLPWLVGALVLGVVAPLAFFQPSRTIWAAIDLGMNPDRD